MSCDLHMQLFCLSLVLFAAGGSSSLSDISPPLSWCTFDVKIEQIKTRGPQCQWSASSVTVCYNQRCTLGGLGWSLNYTQFEHLSLYFAIYFCCQRSILRVVKYNDITKLTYLPFSKFSSNSHLFFDLYPLVFLKEQCSSIMFKYFVITRMCCKYVVNWYSLMQICENVFVLI